MDQHKITMRVMMVTLLVTVMTSLLLPAQALDPSVHPVNCANGKAALVDSLGEHVTDCDYIDFCMLDLHHRNPKSERDPRYVFIFAKRAHHSWVLLNKLGQEVKGPMMVSQMETPIFSISGAHREVISIELDHVFSYLYFKSTNSIKGPFINTWNNPGRIHPGPRDTWGRYARITQDSTLALWDSDGNELALMDNASEYENLSPLHYGCRSPEGELEIRDTLGEVLFEGAYSFSVHRSSVYLTAVANEALTVENKDRVKHAFVDTTGKLILDTLYTKIEPFPTTTWLGRHSRSLHSAQIDGHHVLLDTFLQEVLTSEGAIKVYKGHYFSITDPVSSRMNVYKGDTSRLVFSDLLGYEQSSHHLITTDNGSSLLDLHSLTPMGPALMHVQKTWIGGASYRFVTTEGERGLLDSEGNEIMRLDVDSLSALMLEHYPHTKHFKDSLITYREGEVYGIYDIPNKSRLPLKSEAQIMVSNSKDIYIYSENGMKGFYHAPTGRKEPAIYQHIYVTREFDHRDDPYADHAIDCIRADESRKLFYQYGAHCVEAHKLPDLHPSYVADFKIESRQGQQYLVDKRTRALLLPEGYDRIDTICDGLKNTMFYKLKKQGKISYFNADLQQISPAESRWSSAHPLRHDPALLIVQDGKRKNSRGLYDLRNQVYLIPPEHCSIRDLQNGKHVILCTKDGKALCRQDGHRLTGFDYKRIFGMRHSAYLIGHLKDESVVMLDTKGQIVNDEVYASVKGIYTQQSAQQKSYYQITRHTQDSLSIIMDEAHETVMELPSSHSYRVLPGPLDYIITSETRPYEGILVKDFSLIPIGLKGSSHDFNGAKSVLRNGKHYYEIPTAEGHMIYDQNGQHLLTLPPGHKLYTRYGKSIPDTHPFRHYLTSGPGNANQTAYHTLEGEPICDTCGRSRINTFGNYETLCGGKKYYFK